MFEELLRKGIINIDIYNSTKLKENQEQHKIQKTFEGYNLLVDETFEQLKGKCWHRMGDGGIFLFPKPEDAVMASLQLLNKLSEFNEEKNNLDLPVFVRIGIHQEDDDLENVEETERGKYAHSALDVAGKLQKNCPLGKIAISQEVYNRLGVLQTLFRLSLITPITLKGKGVFVLADRAINGTMRKLSRGLPEAQMRLIPPIPYPSWEHIKPDENINLTKLNEFFNRKKILLILGETGKHPNSPIASAATSDAVGIMEVMGLLQSNENINAGIAVWEDTADLVSDSNVVVVGSSIVNIYAFALNDLILPLHFVKNSSNNQIYDQIVATSKTGSMHFGPHSKSPSPRDSALVIITKSPFNVVERSLLWVAGITGMGTQVASRFIWDLIKDPAILNQKLGGHLINPIGCVVAPNIPLGLWDISDYYRRWRVLDYKILWAVDKDGNSLCLNNNYNR